MPSVLSWGRIAEVREHSYLCPSALTLYIKRTKWHLQTCEGKEQWKWLQGHLKIALKYQFKLKNYEKEPTIRKIKRSLRKKITITVFYLTVCLIFGDFRNPITKTLFFLFFNLDMLLTSWDGKTCWIVTAEQMNALFQSIQVRDLGPQYKS